MNFRLYRSDFTTIKLAYIAVERLCAEQSTITRQSNTYLISNPPETTGKYTISFRIYRDGSKEAIVGDSHD